MKEPSNNALKLPAHGQVHDTLWAPQLSAVLDGRSDR
jgi:hypothetical protein